MVFVGRVLGMVVTSWMLVTNHILVQYIRQRNENTINISVLGIHAI